MTEYLSEEWWQRHYPTFPVELRPVLVALAEHLETSYRLADDALAAIDEAGFVLVERERFERQQKALSAQGMSDRAELLKRLSLVIGATAEARCADDGDGYVDEWVTNTEAAADAVLAEIEREHVIVPRGEWEECVCCECEDCYPELTQAAGKPLPEGVTSVSWGWGELPESG